jgi:hypothetical protein
MMKSEATFSVHNLKCNYSCSHSEPAPSLCSSSRLVEQRRHVILRLWPSWDGVLLSVQYHANGKRHLHNVCSRLMLLRQALSLV